MYEDVKEQDFQATVSGVCVCVSGLAWVSLCVGLWVYASALILHYCKGTLQTAFNPGCGIHLQITIHQNMGY